MQISYEMVSNAHVYQLSVSLSCPFKQFKIILSKKSDPVQKLPCFSVELTNKDTVRLKGN